MDGKWDDPELIHPEVLSFLHSADHVIANVEGALISRESVSSQGVQQLLHAMNPAAVRVLDHMHADVWNLCNNHIMDAGEEGIASTLRIAGEHHAVTLGAGRNLAEAMEPLLLPQAGGIGIFSCGYRRGCKPAGADHAGCLLWNDLDNIQHVIDRIRRTCRTCIMVCHGGEEFTSLPSPYTRERYHRFLEMGVDILVSHHPHVPMNYETVGTKTIFYSLGNFIFDTDYQRAQFNTEKGILLRLDIGQDGYRWIPFGIQIDRETEHVVPAPLPDIFRDVQDEEYRKLSPLAAKMMVAAYRRQQIFLKPQEYGNADEEKWERNFLDPKRSGRVPGEGLDFQVILPLAAQAQQGEWKTSRLEDVKQYILRQM